MKMACYYRAFWLICFLPAWIGCTENDRREADIRHIEITLPVERLETALFACNSEQEVLAFLDKHPALFVAYFPDFAGEKTALAAQLFQNIRNPALLDFKQQLDAGFSDFDQTVAEPLQRAFKHLKYYYPEAPVPKVQTMITGFSGSDLFVSDTLLVIGLDYFGGPDARFRPDVHNYQLVRYQKEYIVPSIMFFIAQRYNRSNPEDRSLLADMIWYGKNYEFVKHMMPQTPDSLILGLSQENLAKAVVSQKDIWAHFTSEKLLYEYLEQKKQKYVGERPITYEIGEDVPGGIGRWVGWRIINRLVQERPEITLQQVMANDNARVLLEESGYRGQRE
jgi:hypothetical protein